MIHRITRNGFALRESRMIFWFKEVGSNVGTWGKDVGSTYLAQGVQERDPIKMVAGIPMAAGSAFFEGLDYLYAGVVDERLSPPSGTRVGRDISAIMKNNVVHPIRTIVSGVRLIGDIPLDIGDAAFRFKHNSYATRAAINKTLAA